VPDNICIPPASAAANIHRPPSLHARISGSITHGIHAMLAE
jgi:hypothetical protein